MGCVGGNNSFPRNLPSNLSQIIGADDIKRQLLEAEYVAPIFCLTSIQKSQN